MKATLGLLALAAVSAWALATGRLGGRRAVLALTVPPAVYLAVAMASGMNIGIRHLLPVIAWLAVLGGAGAVALARTGRRGALVAAALLALHAGSTAAAFPEYVSYANEAWGGSARSHLLLTDSSVDWGEQLLSVKRWCVAHGITDGWFAYFGQGVLEPSGYGLPLRPLPTADSLWIGEPIQVPPVIEGTVLVSAGVLSGFEFGPGPLDPYAEFRTLPPVDVIDHAVFVYRGRFELPLASALGRAQQAVALAGEHRAREALAEAEEAVRLAPRAVAAWSSLGDALAEDGRRDEARDAHRRALSLAREVEPRFQAGWVTELEGKLAKP
ncbi:MAG: hypothetical protein QM704_24325 [Anaeromyxobacteraceae bacterium]